MQGYGGMKNGIRQRGKNSYQIVVELPPDPLTGKRRQHIETVRGTRKDAEIRKAEIITSLSHGNYTATNKLTLGDYLKQWLENCCYDLAPRTKESYEKIINLHLIPNLGHILLKDLKPMHIQQYYRQALERGRKDHRGQSLSPSTVIKHHRVLRAALKQAVGWDMLNKNPADFVKPPKQQKIKFKCQELR